jgi:hypothetical protein
MKEFLKKCPMSPPVSTPHPKKKRKTKADIEAELLATSSKLEEINNEKSSLLERNYVLEIAL